MIKINIKEWIRRDEFEAFNSFDNPCYTLTSRICVSNLLRLHNEQKYSFFIMYMYCINMACNRNPSFLYRIIDNEVYCYDKINISAVIKNNSGKLVTVEIPCNYDFAVYYANALNIINKAKKNNEKAFENNVANVIYVSCIPWISTTSMTHPLPSPNNKMSLSIPRFAWDKYIEDDGDWYVNMNICVNHALVNGEELAKVFVDTQDEINKLSNVIGDERL